MQWLKTFQVSIAPVLVSFHRSKAAKCARARSIRQPRATEL
jgi:hypothetical protein